MNILQKIFTDHYEEIKYTLHPRDTEMENIEKMIHCGDPSFGGAMYHCPHCGNFKYVPFHCHSRFCPSCGNKYSMERTTSMTFKLINVKHRHCVFTIDENLRDFFLKERSLLDCLFHSVASVISRMFFELNKSKNFTPGFIMVLHTFLPLISSKTEKPQKPYGFRGILYLNIMSSCDNKSIFRLYYSMIVATFPDPTVRPPSRIANPRPSSIATG